MRKKIENELLGRLLSAYKAKNLRQLSKFLGIPNSTMDGWIKGNSGFSAEFLLRFENETGHSIQWLLNGDEEEASKPTYALFFGAAQKAKQLKDPVNQAISRELEDMIDAKLEELLHREKQMEK